MINVKLTKYNLYDYLKSIYPDVVKEYKFLENRKFRADFYIPSKNCLIEYEGLNSKKSRHTTKTGYTKDCEKYNLASIAGYRIIRITALNINDIKKFLDLL